jgi:hypothetical protein
MKPAIIKKAAFFCLLLPGCASHVLAQVSSPDALTFPNVALSRPAVRERDLGSVGGRVFDSSVEQVGDSDGIAEVTVILRSADPGFENFSREKITNEKGIYTFQDLPPGNYIVSIASVNLPWKFRAVEPSGAAFVIKPLTRTFVDLTVAPQRAVTGVVFLDKDGDGRFDQNSETPVVGARVSFNGAYAVSGPNGSFFLSDLPAGRIGFLVADPHSGHNAHVVLELPERSTRPRIVNVPLNP